MRGYSRRHQRSGHGAVSKIGKNIGWFSKRKAGTVRIIPWQFLVADRDIALCFNTDDRTGVELLAITWIMDRFAVLTSPGNGQPEQQGLCDCLIGTRHG